MKLSVSLPDEDVQYLDEYMKREMIETRSAAIQRAIQVLRMSDLVEAYKESFDEYPSDEPEDWWEPAPGDGLDGAADAPR